MASLAARLNITGCLKEQRFLKMREKNKLYRFLIEDIGEHLLNFLRNLTPIILMISVSIFIFMKNPNLDIFNANWPATILGFSALFIGGIAMVANITIFARKSLLAFSELKEYEQNKINNGERVGLFEMLNFMWKKDGFSQIFVFYLITLISLTVILISSFFAAINLLKNLPAN